MRTQSLLALMVMAALPLQVASAEAPATGQFLVGTTGISWEAPQGYCIPAGRREATAQLLASADITNITDLTLTRCGDDTMPFDDYILIKTPKDDVPTAIGLAELLQGLGPTFDNPAFAEMLRSGRVDDQAVAGFDRIFGAAAADKSNIASLGHDDVCAYLGGVVVSSAGEMTKTSTFIGCVTSVRTKLLMIYSYAPPGGIALVARLAGQARAFAIDLATRNKVAN